jgi:four helix bundle protein
METEIKSYKDLLVWQKAMDLTVLIYKITESFPKTEIYGLVSQMKRCAVSIPSNIAEGKFRGSRKDFRQFLIIAFASGAELETQMEISKRLGFVKLEAFTEAELLLAEVLKMLNKFISSLAIADPNI